MSASARAVARQVLAPMGLLAIVRVLPWLATTNGFASVSWSLALSTAQIALAGLLAIGVFRRFRAGPIRGALGRGVLPLLLVATAGDEPWQTAADVIALVRWQGELRGRAEASPMPAGARFAAVETSDCMLMSRGLAYDDSGEIAAPPTSRSLAWRERAAGAGLVSDNVTAVHLVGPYYRWFSW